jgi:hypothetical protein
MARRAKLFAARVLVALLGVALVLEVNRRMTHTRRGSRKPEKFLSEHGIAVSAIAESDPDNEVWFWREFLHDWQELSFYAFILVVSITPALLLRCYWNDLSKAAASDNGAVIVV